MNITVTADAPVDNTITAHVTVGAKDVDAAIAATYKDIAHRYNFQGFRRGHAPRPVIDSIVGKEAVRAQATNDILNEVEPYVLEHLDLVPVTQLSFGDEPDVAEDGKDYEATATIEVRPEAELTSYDAPTIDLPPEEATEAEIDLQVRQLLSYQTSYKDVEDDRPAQEGDFVSVDVEDVEGESGLAGKARMLHLDGSGIPAELQAGIVGMKKGETKEASWTTGSGDDAAAHTVRVTLDAIREEVTPELTDELAKSSFGFDTVQALRDAVKEEIESDKKQSLPGLKEDRVVEAEGKLLDLDKVPDNYRQQIFQELANEFLGRLQRQGISLDNFLKIRGISMDAFLADLQAQAEERARQSLALDALARHLGLTASEDEVLEEFKKAGAEDPKATMEQWRDEGRLPAVRESVKRTKALDWLTENATVNVVDEVAQREAAKDDAADETHEAIEGDLASEVADDAAGTDEQ